MIILGVVGLLIVAAIAILILQARKARPARAWIVALASSLAAWLAIFVLRLYLPTTIKLIAWEPQNLFHAIPALSLDYLNWPYALAVMTLCMAVIFTDSTKSSLGASTKTWASSIALTAMNLFAILAYDPVTMALMWMLIDFVELVSVLNLQSATSSNTKLTSVFGIRMLSTLVLIGATGHGWQFLPDFSFAEIPVASSIFFLVAAGLRLGVLQMDRAQFIAPELRHGVGLLFRLTPGASAMALIAHLPGDFLTINTGLLTFIRVFTSIAAIYSAAMWLTRKTEYEGRPYWITTLSAFMVICTLNGSPSASRPWGLALLLTGGVLFLFDPPIRRIRFIPMLGLLGIMGLPYTLAASGWQGLVGDNFTITSILMILSHAMLVMGYLRYIIESNSTVTGLEKYARITYPLGLILIVQTVLVLGLVGWPGVATVGSWLPAAVSFGIVVLAGIGSLRLGVLLPSTDLPRKLPFFSFIARVFSSIGTLLSLDWLYSSGRWLFSRLGDLGRLIVRLFEGEGGMLWSLVFIVVLMLLVGQLVTP